MRLPVSQSPPATTQHYFFVDIIAQENILGFSTNQDKISHNFSVISLLNLKPVVELETRSEQIEVHQLYLVKDFLVLANIKDQGNKCYMIIANKSVSIDEFFLESFISDEFSKEMFEHWDQYRRKLNEAAMAEDFDVELCLPTIGNLSHMQRFYL